jgi:hypothetical protein
MLTIILRIAHIVCGALWVGFAVFAGLIMMPSLQEAGPAGGKVMAALQKRGVATIPPILAIATLASGVWLYWRLTAGFESAAVTGAVGATYGVGGVLAITAFVIGMAMLRPAMLRAGELARRLGEATGEATEAEKAQRAEMAAELGRVRARGAAGGALVALLLIVATTAMAIARYM